MGAEKMIGLARKSDMGGIPSFGMCIMRDIRPHASLKATGTTNFPA
jgi:hypothetical protein